MKKFILRLFPNSYLLKIVEKDCFEYTMTKSTITEPLARDPLKFSKSFIDLFKNPFKYLRSTDDVLKNYSQRFIKEDLLECDLLILTYERNYIIDSRKIHLTRN